MKELARVLIILGASSLGIGLILYVFSSVTGIGKLPGDIEVRGKSFVFYFPIVTCIVLSLVITLILNIFFRK